MPRPDPVPIIVPTSLWESDGTEEAVLSEWLAADGTPIEAGAPLAEIMVDKVSLTLDAPASGMLEIRTPEGAPVGLGTTIAIIRPG